MLPLGQWILYILLALACIRALLNVPLLLLHSHALSQYTLEDERPVDRFSAWPMWVRSRHAISCRWAGRRRVVTRTGLHRRILLKRAWASALAPNNTSLVLRSCGYQSSDWCRLRLSHVQNWAYTSLAQDKSDRSQAIPPLGGYRGPGCNFDGPIVQKTPACSSAQLSTVCNEDFTSSSSSTSMCHRPQSIPYKSYTRYDQGNGCVFRCLQMMYGWVLAERIHPHMITSTSLPTIRSLVRLARKGPEATDLECVPWLSVLGAAHIWTHLTTIEPRIAVLNNAVSAHDFLDLHFREHRTPVLATYGTAAYVIHGLVRSSSSDSITVVISDPHPELQHNPRHGIQHNFIVSNEACIAVMCPTSAPTPSIAHDVKVGRCGAPKHWPTIDLTHDSDAASSGNEDAMPHAMVSGQFQGPRARRIYSQPVWRGHTWRWVRDEMNRDIRINKSRWSMCHHGQPVDLDAVVPIPAEDILHGHQLEVTLHRHVHPAEPLAPNEQQPEPLAPAHLPDLHQFLRDHVLHLPHLQPVTLPDILQPLGLDCGPTITAGTLRTALLCWYLDHLPWVTSVALLHGAISIHDDITLADMLWMQIEIQPLQAAGGIDDLDQYKKAQTRLRKCSHSFAPLQVNLLLRGDEKLQRRIVNARTEADVHNIFHSAATRYGLVEKPAAGSIGRAPSQDVNASQTRTPRGHGNRSQSSPPQESTPGWKTVSRRKGTSGTQQTETSDDTLQHELIQADWSHLVLTYPRVGTAGVYLAKDETDAQRAEQYCLSAVQPMALVSIVPLSRARYYQAITFRVMEHHTGRPSVERVLDGYLCQYSKDFVQLHYEVIDLKHKRTQASTRVLTCNTGRSYIWPQEWKDLVAITTAAQLNAFLAPHNLVAQDIFKIKLEGDHLHFLVRVAEQHVDGWFRSQIPLAVGPVGDESERFRVYWDQSLRYLTDVPYRYELVTGYSGPVVSPKGLGVRFLRESFDDAMCQIGKTPGELYEIYGVPLEADEQDLQDIVDAMPWDAQVQPNSRKIRGGATCSWRIRSSVEPSSTVVRYTDQHQRHTLHLRHVQRNLPKPKPVQELQPPKTWSDVAKRSIGHIDTSCSSSLINPWASSGWWVPHQVAKPNSKHVHYAPPVPEKETVDSMEWMPCLQTWWEPPEDMDFDSRQTSKRPRVEDDHVGHKDGVPTDAPHRPDDVNPERLDRVERDMHELKTLMQQLLQMQQANATANAF
eukprot:6490834-Amphidinium_carterae.1